MSLASLLPEPTKIKVGSGEVSVRPLSASDISILLRLHASDFEEIGTIFDEMRRDTGAPMDDRAVARVLMDLVSRAPALIANLIACVCDEDDSSVASRLPVTVQVEILHACFRATFEDYGGPGKFWATLVAMLTSAGLGRSNPTPTPELSPIN